jgi:hypothetical protein
MNRLLDSFLVDIIVRLALAILQAIGIALMLWGLGIVK